MFRYTTALSMATPCPLLHQNGHVIQAEEAGGQESADQAAGGEESWVLET